MKIVILFFFSILYVTPAILQGHTTASHVILIVGGAGFIGSHVNEMLYRQGYKTIILDNLSTGNRDSIKHGLFIEGDLADCLLIDQIFNSHQIDAVMHFAALKDVGESVRDPLRYYENNVCGTLNLLDAMLKHDVKTIIFSSTAAIFGVPEHLPIEEDHPCHPINPYGRTKLIVEKILQDFDRAFGLRYSCLRYFNAAGGDPEGKIKNHQENDSNLIPIVLRSLQKSNSHITIFGTDYPTADGTCIRDYVHIQDLGSAHIAALEMLLKGAPSSCYNLGSGQGFSVRQVIAAVEKVTGKKVNVQLGARRLGDPPILIASSDKAIAELDWHPAYSSLELMIEHAWNAMR